MATCSPVRMRGNSSFVQQKDVVFGKVPCGVQIRGHACDQCVVRWVPDGCVLRMNTLKFQDTVPERVQVHHVDRSRQKTEYQVTGPAELRAPTGSRTQRILPRRYLVRQCNNPLGERAAAFAPRPGPGRPVHRRVRRGPGRCGHRCPQDPCQLSTRERLRREVRAHRPHRTHRPSAHLRATPPQARAGRVRQALQPPTPAPQPPTTAAALRPAHPRLTSPADHSPNRAGGLINECQPAA
jgi:hypothetical protein